MLEPQSPTERTFPVTMERLQRWHINVTVSLQDHNCRRSFQKRSCIHLWLLWWWTHEGFPHQFQSFGPTFLHIVTFSVYAQLPLLAVITKSRRLGGPEGTPSSTNPTLWNLQSMPWFGPNTLLVIDLNNLNPAQILEGECCYPWKSVWLGGWARKTEVEFKISLFRTTRCPQLKEKLFLTSGYLQISAVSHLTCSLFDSIKNRSNMQRTLKNGSNRLNMNIHYNYRMFLSTWDGSLHFNAIFNSDNVTFTKEYFDIFIMFRCCIKDIFVAYMEAPKCLWSCSLKSNNSVLR